MTSIDEIVNVNEIVLILFGSESCPPCYVVWQKLQEMELSDKVYISVDEHPRLAAQAGVLSVPTIHLYVNGKIAWEKSGTFGLNEVINRIKRLQNIIK